jgi:hypothetical protein
MKRDGALTKRICLPGILTLLFLALRSNSGQLSASVPRVFAASNASDTYPVPETAHSAFDRIYGNIPLIERELWSISIRHLLE